MTARTRFPSRSTRWWSSYSGRGAGQPTRDCFAEPYIGPLNGDVTVVALGLNPGRAHPELQARDADDPQVLTFELYPWHSTRMTGAMKPPSDVISDFVWGPISDLGAQLVFAFGRPWARVCEALGLAPAKRCAAGDPDFPTRVRSRVIQTYHLPDGGRVVVCWQSGYAGPPGREDTRLLRDLLSR